VKLIYPSDKELYPFQKKAIRKMLKFLTTNETNSVYNACEQGLGKTIQALTVCNTLKPNAIIASNTLKANTVLILCPAIMRLVWEEEIERWFETEHHNVIPLTHVFLSGKNIPAKNELKSCNYVVCSYDLARTPKILTLLKSLNYDVVIYDEAHYLNNTRSKRTKACLRTLWDRATFHILLSGTPFTTSVVNGYSCFHRILPSAFPDFPTFVSGFCFERITPWGKEYFGVKNADILRKIIRKTFYIRYTKEEVLPDLPDKIYQRITLPIEYAIVPKGSTEKEELEAEIEMIRRAIETGKPVPIPPHLAEHRRLQGEAKVKPICDFIHNQLENEIPVVCFAHHRKVISDINEEFKKYTPAVITGSTSAPGRSEAIKRFQEGKSNLFIGNFVAAGTGITLTRSSTVVLAELDWSPSILSQAIDRCHRIGQKDSVNVYWFVVKNSLDETISNVVMNRTRIFRSVLE
jgi:SWI/SNF-related matrix-associated actin-dependent regulator 1 of chromatin subfamily A